MKIRRLSLTIGLLAAPLLLGATAARACKYCWAAEAAGADYAQQTMPTTAPGDNPLDATISQFKPAPAPAALATPPPVDSVVTSAAELKAAKLAAKATSSPAPVVAPLAAPIAPAPAVAQASGSGHYADAGLVGLAAVGGVFCWRTRRKTGPGR